mgnify:CR=1 FL=1
MITKNLTLAAALGLCAMLAPAGADACTNLIAGKKATKDGSTMVTYAADSHTLYGALYHQPAADQSPSTGVSSGRKVWGAGTRQPFSSASTAMPWRASASSVIST